MCVFFKFLNFCVITVWGIKTTSIFFNGILFDGKVNLDGVLGGQHLKFPIVFQSAGKNKIKIKGKREFLLKNGFRQNRYWFLVQL